MAKNLAKFLLLAFLLCCSAAGDKPDGFTENPQNPQYYSLLGHFIALSDSNQMSGLAEAVRILMKTNQLRELVDSIDIAIRSVGGANLKKILREVLIDTSLREFLRAEGPLSKLLEYADIVKSLDTLHI
ncbi:MAG: hypothetical protein N3B13_08675, partial [Deltaproteobacteria bacterium]|nr:hypothetical protein [Deltaproteobacteria bacterium]